MKTKTLPLLLTLTQTHPSQADVDVYQASFSKDFNDTLAPRDRRSTKTITLKRTYKSRSLNQGAFGFGWCTQMEKKLEIQNATTLQFYDCENAQPLTFQKQSQMRGHYALFTSKQKPNEFMWFRDNQYEHYRDNQLMQKFNSLGLLSHWITPDKTPWRLVYGVDARLSQIQLPDQTFYFQWNAGGQITQLKSPAATFDYVYDKGDLTEVKRNGQSEYRYQYDELHNLKEIKRVDGSTETISYDQDKDWVLQYKRSVCVETFDYQSKLTSTDTFTTEKTKTCPNMPVLKTRYTFQHKKDNTNRSYLARISIETGSLKTFFELNPVTGQLQKMASGKESRAMAFETKTKGNRNVGTDRVIQNIETSSYGTDTSAKPRPNRK